MATALDSGSSLAALLAYSDNCRRVLKETLEANAAAWDGPIVPKPMWFSTIREIVAHTAGAEERWVRMRLQGEDVPFYTDRAPASIEGVFADWDRFRAETRSFLASRNAGDMETVHTLTMQNGWTGDLTVTQILFHVLNHETHHRAQVSLILQQMGIEPPDFDYIYHHG